MKDEFTKNWIIENSVDILSNYEEGVLTIRGYKKGTMHFEFIDEDLWYKFNSMVAKSRGWELPQNTGKKKKQ